MRPPSGRYRHWCFAVSFGDYGTSEPYSELLTPLYYKYMLHSEILWFGVLGPFSGAYGGFELIWVGRGGGCQNPKTLSRVGVWDLGLRALALGLLGVQICQIGFRGLVLRALRPGKHTSARNT